jgi:phosphoserine phosphatase
MKNGKIALIYDFDGTLASGNLPEHSFLPSLGVNDFKKFWDENRSLVESRDADEVLTYMWSLLELAKAKKVDVTRSMLVSHGAKTPYFPGVEEWFDRIEAHGKSLELSVEHYVISSGLLEMIEGCSIFSKFRRVFACSYAYDEQGRAIWPAVSINYTNKTQFLFRINKGIENAWDNKQINRWQPPSERPIPFTRMIFIGDGDTDIPSMKMVRYQGGQAVAVYDPAKWAERKAQNKLQELIAEDRADYVSPADFREHEQLDIVVKGIMGRMVVRPDRVVPRR